MGAKKFRVLLGSYKLARGLTDYEADMIRDEYKGSTFAMANTDLPRDSFHKAV